MSGGWRFSSRMVGVAVVSVLVISSAVVAATFSVTTTADSGAGSLRAAIEDANASVGTDTIEFAIPGSAPFVISPESPLPDITESVILDGTTQDGLACGSPPVVVIHGMLAGGGAHGLTLLADDNVVRRVVVNDFGGNGIRIVGSRNRIECSLIGTNHLGATAVPNTIGIALDSGSDNVIGTNGDGAADADEGNLISGNTLDGVSILSATGTVVAGNRIGTNLAGTAALANDVGVRTAVFGGGAATRIGTNGDGTSDLAERNVISGNTTAGVRVSDGSAVIDGNLVGTDLTGATALKNGIGIDLLFEEFESRTPTGTDSQVFGGPGPSGDGYVPLLALVARNFIGFNDIGVRIDTDSFDFADSDTPSSDSRDNCVAGNTAGVEAFGMSPALFGANWWGDPDGPTVPKGLPEGDTVTAEVVFGSPDDDPFLTAPAAACAGTIRIIKDTVPDGPQDFAFTTTGGLTPASFSLDDDADGTLSNTQTFTSVAIGGYTVTETAVPGFATTIACVDPDGGTSTTGVTATIDVDAGETITCTYTNTELGTIRIIKDTVPDGPQDFEFTTTGGLTPASFSLDDDADGTLSNTQTFTSVAIGSYSVTETAVPGFATTIACVDPDGGTSTSGATATIDVDAGETITCTYTNTELGTIRIIKDTVPDGPQDFEFTTTGGLTPASFSLDDDADATLSNTQTFTSVAIGSYSVTETAVPGFATTIACVDPDGGTSTSGATATIDVDAGETITCTFTNTADVPPCVTGPTATASGDATLCLIGATNDCHLDGVRFVALSGDELSPPAESSPPGFTFPHGLFAFMVAPSCTPGFTADITLTLPAALPLGTQYWKYGRTAANPTPHWYVLPVTIGGNVISFSITDGGLGDHDLVANGTIDDPGGPGVPASDIPALSPLALLLLAGLLGGAGLLIARRGLG